MDPYFAGKTALVTGAGSGIGRELVYKLSDLGASVIAVGQTQSKLESLKSEIGGSLTIVAVDLADWDATETKLKPLCDNIDFLVNNAGYACVLPVDEIIKENVDKCVDVNLKAPMNLINMIAPGMKKRKSGSIVNVSSVAGISALDGHIAYAASKAALDMVTKICAKELGPYNVRVNSVNPTVVWTKMSIDYWSEPTKKATMLSKIPMNRFAEIREVVDPIVFLLSEKSSFLNGTIMPIDGGFVAT